MAELTRKEFYEKYGDIGVTFSNYYKFAFTFAGVTPEGYVIEVGYGGSAEEIYRYELSNNETDIVKNIAPYIGTVWDKAGNEIDSFYDY